MDGDGADKRATARASGPVASFEEWRRGSSVDCRSNGTRLSKRIESIRSANFVWAMKGATRIIRIGAWTNDLPVAPHRSRCPSRQARNVAYL
ncbi:hypothetical protein DIE08_06635 [Burkholderia sp. Bp9004]|nr:hypothetical protein DIE08_06635 [Burkholderia sp. Bp9004]